MTAPACFSGLTMAQVYVLRRMASGTKYAINGDFRRALELRTFMGRPDDICCRSTPVLFRLGLTEIEGRPSVLEKGRYYRLKLTPSGLEALRANADRSS
ncbi:hypothetical protein I7V28_19135 [Lelliottia amnigena]|nr:hypothetical protein [Lelliottia aquatilis]MBL5923197.1 hypothetical protein [Lelliottia amnigena]MBL5932108.1 hypothetical protein [Lelliottia amnigena]